MHSYPKALIRVQPAGKLSCKCAQGQFAEAIVLQALPQPEFREGAEVLEIHGIRRTVRFGCDEYYARGCSSLMRRAHYTVLQPSVDHHPVRQEMDREHHLVSLRGLS